MIRRYFSLPFALLAAGCTCDAAPITIENSTLSVTFEAIGSSGSFTVREKSTLKAVIQDGRLMPGIPLSTNQSASLIGTTDPIFGAGRKIQIPLAGGGSVSLELYPTLPFLLISSELKNDGLDSKDVPSIVTATFSLDLGKPADQLRTMGTGGLTAPEKNPGSYLFLTCADPETRHGVVAGWLTQDRGSGVVFSDSINGKASFKSQIDYGHLIIPAGQSAKLETLALGVFPDARIGLEQFGDAVKQVYQIKLRKPDAVYCTWYSDGKDHGGAGTEATTLELSKFIAKELKPFGLGVIQIDDQWQDGKKFEGPRRGFERHLPGGPYPNGITPVAKALSNDGLSLGLWWMPFSRNHQSEDFRDRQDWFVKRADGSPYENKWGGTSLDLTRPEVKKHLSDIAADYRRWGVGYFKMDGFSTGAACKSVYINDGYKNDDFGDNQPFHDPQVTNIEAFRNGIRLLRESAGDDVFFSGCCVSQSMRSFFAAGLVDAMRIGPDFNHDGQGIRSGPLRGSRLYFMNGRIWWNDPDPTKVRSSNVTGGADKSAAGGVSLEQAQLTTSWVSLSGQFFLISDWLPYLPAERIEILKRTLAHHNASARPVDYFDNELANTWLVSDTKSSIRRDVIGVFNFYPEPLKVSHTLARLGLNPEKSYHAFDFWKNCLLPDIKGSFQSEPAPNSCQVVALRADEGRPVLLSTSRHVTQGMLEVTDETWSNNTLSGTSALISKDPYELRIRIPDGWMLDSVKVAPAAKSRSQSIATTHTVSPGLLRITIHYESSPEVPVNWAVKFKR